MSKRAARTPAYRLHRPTGQAVVTLDGRDRYLGKHGTAESKAKYDRLVGEWMLAGRSTPSVDDLSVAELLLAYDDFVDVYYRKNGRPTSEAGLIRSSLKPVRELYGDTLAREFGPLKLKVVRQRFIESGCCRNECNKRAQRVTRCFKWGVENEMIPPSVHHGLQAVRGLPKGRTNARESIPVRPVPERFIEAIGPFVSRQVSAMVAIQRLTGMRPGEVVTMRTIDLDMTGRVWVYTPEEHKTEHHGRIRQVIIGPRAQAIIRPWIGTELAAYLFSPMEAMDEHRAEERRNRKTKVQPSQQNRKQSDPSKRPGQRYTTASYRRAIAVACAKASKANKELGIDNPEIPQWHPHQLRHNAATYLRKEFGLDVARVILGHKSPMVTEIYAELDMNRAIDAMERVG